MLAGEAEICSHHHHVTNQAIASMPSTPRPTGAEGRGSTAPECLQVLRICSQDFQPWWRGPHLDVSTASVALCL
jgi:hypothetical protein